MRRLACLLLGHDPPPYCHRTCRCLRCGQTLATA